MIIGTVIAVMTMIIRTIVIIGAVQGLYSGALEAFKGFDHGSQNLDKCEKSTTAGPGPPPPPPGRCEWPKGFQTELPHGLISQIDIIFVTIQIPTGSPQYIYWGQIQTPAIHHPPKTMPNEAPVDFGLSLVAVLIGWGPKRVPLLAARRAWFTDSSGFFCSKLRMGPNRSE